MTQANVERLMEFYGAFNSGDGLEAFVEFADPGFVYHTRSEFPDGGSYDADGALGRLAELRQTLAGIRWEPQEFIEAGDRTVVIVRQTARGRASGAPVDHTIAHVWTARADDGKATELAVFSDRAAALEAAGLSE
jgi:ketosteroid isomerase-like protein